MVPMRMSTVFKNRWMALIWAAGILWFAYDFASPSADAGNGAANATEPTDVTGAPIKPEDEQKFANIVQGL